LRKRMDIIQERRRNFDAEWTKLNEEERKLSEKRESLMEKSAQAVAADHYHSSKGDDDALKYKYEIEKLKLEKADLEGRLASMQRLIEKINDNLNSESRLASKELNRLDHSLEDSSVADSDKFMAKVNSVNSKLGYK
jgi:arginine decarboxylase-like protein